jgi:hypothetical protein
MGFSSKISVLLVVGVRHRHIDTRDMRTGTSGEVTPDEFPVGSRTTAGGAVDAPASSNPTGPIQGKAIGTIRPGLYPDFVGADLPSAVSVLYENDMNFVIVEVYNADTPQGLVISQKPAAGAKANDNTAITLTVSKGPASSQ